MQKDENSQLKPFFNQWFRNTIDTPDAMCSTNGNGEILFANKAMWELLGIFNSETHKETTISEFFENKNDQIELFSLLRQRGIVSQFSTQLQFKSEPIIDVEITAIYIQFPEQPLYLHLFQRKKESKQLEITRERYLGFLQKRIEEINVLTEINDLIAQEKPITTILKTFCTQIQTLYDYMTVDLIFIPPNGNGIYSYSTHENQFHRHVKQFLGIPIPNQKISFLEERIDQFVVLANPEAVREFLETLNPKLLQAEVSAEASGIGVYSAIIAPISIQDQCIGILGISSTKELTEQDGILLRQFIQQITFFLEKMILIKDLERSNQALAEYNKRFIELDRLQSSFLAATSHELRTPLTSIKGYAELATQGKLGPISEQVDEAFDIILKNAKRLERLANDTHDQSKIDADKLSLKLERLDIKSLVKECIQTMRPLIESHRHQLQLKIVENLPKIEGDSYRIAQVLRNLLENSAKFTPEGGRIEVRIRELPNSILIEIEDTGIGINPEDLDRVFDRFVRSEGTELIAGSGLGLSIAKEIVIRHGGWIWAESEGIGKGSTFFFTLPK